MIKLPCLLLIISLSATKAQQIKKDHELVRQLIAEDLGSRSFSFSQVVKSATGKNVIPFDHKNPNHKTILNHINKTIKHTIKTLNKPNSPIKKISRINEASRYFEKSILNQLNKHPDINCSIPSNIKGKKQLSGYPDLRIKHIPSNTTFYLDPKLYNEKSKSSSLRTFYFEPKLRTIKILDNAVHILLGISHDGKHQNWTFTNWEIIDLAKLQMRLKTEFQASNKVIYTNKNRIDSSKLHQQPLQKN